MWFCHKSLGCCKAKVETWRGCMTFPSDDVTQFTGYSRLSLLCYLWLQTSPRSSCFCYYQHDWVTQQLLHFPIWTLGSTHRSIAAHLLSRPSCPSVRRKIGVLTATCQLFEKTTFNQQPTPLHHNYYYYYYYYYYYHHHHHHQQQPSSGNSFRQYNPRPSSHIITTLTSVDVACISTTMAASHPNCLPTIFFCLHVNAFLCPTTVQSGIILKLN